MLPAKILSLLHLTHVATAVLMVAGALGCAVGGSVVDAVAVLVVFAVGVHGCAVLTRPDVLFRQPLTLHIRLNPEVGEEDKEEGSVHPDKVDDNGELVVTTVHEVILSSMKRYQDKLGLLDTETKTSVKVFLHSGFFHLRRSYRAKCTSCLLT